MSGLLELQNVSLTHGHRTAWPQPALHDISLRVPAGERLLVTGSNGSGKSTLAWLLAGMIEPTSGTATYDGQPLSDARHDIGLLVQHTRLQLLRPTVAEEVGSYTERVGDRLSALRAMGFSSIDGGRRIDDLSVGQQRRVGLAAQLARRVGVLVLDEPLAGLDPSGRASLSAALSSLPATTTVIIVTHDVEDSRPLGSRLVVLEGGRLKADEEVL